MPVTVKHQGSLWRVVEASNGRIAKNRSGSPIDGGGFSSKAQAQAQARAVNARTGGKDSERSRVSVRRRR